MSEEIKTENKPVKKKGKKALKVLLCILCAILLFVAVTACVSAIGDKANMKKAQSFEKINYENQLVPEKDELGNYTFTADRELKVVQITDVHIGGGWMSLKKDAMALNTVAAMLTAEKPDFVIVTGDIAYPVPFQAGTFNNKISAKIFAELMDTLGVYWTLGFGNHDTEAYSFYSREDISEFYSSGDYEYLIYQPGPEDVSGCGNQVVNVKNSDGIITQSMYILDSHSYTDGDILGVMWKYDNLHDDQVEWYAGMVKKYDEINAAAAGKAGTEPQKINSLMFFHIPLTEMKDAWYEYIENGFKDTENVEYLFGDAGEPKKVVYCGIGDDGMFEKIQELGSTKAVRSMKLRDPWMLI